VTTFPVIENLTALVDAVWAYSSRTLDTATTAASNGSYLDDIGYATWTYTDRSVINPPPVPITAVSAILLGGGGITTTRVVQLACGGINAGHRRLLVNGGGLAFPTAPTPTPAVGASLNIKTLPDCQFTHSPISFTPFAIFDQPQGIEITPKPGTLLHHLYWGQKQFMDGAQASLFSVKDHATQTYLRRTDTLAGAHDLSCISAWNSTGNEQRGVTAIAPRFAICATHFSIGVGATVRFVSASNQVFNRTVASRVAIYDGEWSTDAMLLTLDSDLPDSIVPALLPPDDFYEYFVWYYSEPKFYNPAMTGQIRIFLNAYPEFAERMIPANHYPFLFRRQGNRLSAVGLKMNNVTPDRWQDRGALWQSAGHPLADWVPHNEPIITGDSGGPCFCLVNGRVVLYGTALSAGGGPSYLKHRGLIEAAMGQAANVVDLSSFAKQPSGFD
jgi:hypothetical protein